MEFDWNNAPSEWDGSLTPREVEESFEDPFAIRLLPDSARFSVQARPVREWDRGVQCVSDQRETNTGDLCAPVRSGRTILLSTEIKPNAGTVSLGGKALIGTVQQIAD